MRWLCFLRLGALAVAGALVIGASPIMAGPAAYGDVTNYGKRHDLSPIYFLAPVDLPAVAMRVNVTHDRQCIQRSRHIDVPRTVATGVASTVYLAGRGSGRPHRIPVC